MCSLISHLVYGLQLGIAENYKELLTNQSYGRITGIKRNETWHPLLFKLNKLT